MLHTVPVIDGIARFAQPFDGFVVDLWGVVHDGIRPYEGVVDCLKRLRGQGKTVALLSNAPRRVGSVVAKLREIGVPDDAYDLVLSSGEATHLALRDRDDAFHAALGRRLFHMGPERDVDVYTGLPYEVAASAAEADFVLNTGPDGPDEQVVDYEPVLREARARGLPMICANPDIVVMIGPTMCICAGALAQAYEEMDGQVIYHGKPHPPVYRRVMGLMGIDDPGRLCAIGDSFRTDVAGARAMGMHAVLVAGGIHADDLSDEDGRLDGARVAREGAAAGAMPDAVLMRLVW